MLGLTLGLKLVLTPLVIGAVTLVGRRWGPRVAGMVVGLPVTTGPVSVFLATERGPAFAAQAATGAVAGLIGTGCFCAGYAVVARRRAWPVALVAGLAGLAAATLLLRGATLALPAAAALAIATLVLLWAGVTRLTARDAAEERAAPQGPPPAWDLPGRIAVSTTMVAAVTAGAGLLGSRWSGVLSALPVFGAVLGVFTHRREGRTAAVALMRGLIIGCVSAVLFFAVVGTTLARGAMATSYLAAALTAVVSGALVTHLTRPRRAAPAVVAAAEPTPLRRAA